MILRSFAFLADENVHPEVVAYLRQDGYDVITVDEIDLCGVADQRVLKAALSENRVVITHDSDFGMLAVAIRQDIYGIVYLRPGHIRAESTITMLRTLFASSLDLTPPFLLVATRRDDVIRIRVRPIHL